MSNDPLLSVLVRDIQLAALDAGLDKFVLDTRHWFTQEVVRVTLPGESGGVRITLESIGDLKRIKEVLKTL